VRGSSGKELYLYAPRKRVEKYEERKTVDIAVK
jgi:hypothetical protein